MTSDKQTQLELKANFEQKTSKYINQITNLYSATPTVELGQDEVTIKVELTLNDTDLPQILSSINFPPKKLNPIKIVMPLEFKNKT